MQNDDHYQFPVAFISLENEITSVVEDLNILDSNERDIDMFWNDEVTLYHPSCEVQGARIDDKEECERVADNAEDSGVSKESSGKANFSSHTLHQDSFKKNLKRQNSNNLIKDDDASSATCDGIIVFALFIDFLLK